MSKPLLGVAVAVLLTVILIQTIVLWQTPAPTPSESTAQRAATETVTERLKKFGAVEDLVFDQKTGLFRARVGGRIMYATADGHYLLAGEIYDLKTRQNLTDIVRQESRRDILADLAPESAITYSPDGEPRAVVWVFTDITCPYCQKFHRHIDAYTARGIEVRYLAYPRSGPNSRSWRLAKSVWCAGDRHKALTQAKANQSLTGDASCKSTSIRDQYEAGRDIGLRGTPMIVTSDGRQIGGYLPPQKLASRLNLGS